MSIFCVEWSRCSHSKGCALHFPSFTLLIAKLTTELVGTSCAGPLCCLLKKVGISAIGRRAEGQVRKELCEQPVALQLFPYRSVVYNLFQLWLWAAYEIISGIFMWTWGTKPRPQAPGGWEHMSLICTSRDCGRPEPKKSFPADSALYPHLYRWQPQGSKS